MYDALRSPDVAASHSTLPPACHNRRLTLRLSSEGLARGHIGSHHCAGLAYAERSPRTSRTLWVLPSSTSVIRVCSWLSVLPSHSAWSIPWLTPRGLSIRIS